MVGKAESKEMKGDSEGWVFIEDPDLRPECDYVYPIPVLKHGNFYRTKPKPRHCELDAKFRKGDEFRCGYHTPGVGPYRNTHVPRDEERSNATI